MESSKQVYMSGDELKQLQGASGLSAEDFAKTKLNMSRSKFLKLCDLAEIPREVEALIDSKPELSTLANAITKKPSGPEVQLNTLVQGFQDTLIILSRTVTSNEKALDLTERAVIMTEKALEVIERANEKLSKTNENLGSMFEQLVKSGNLTIKTPANL